MIRKKLLVVIAGPTAVGKTSLTIDLAKHFKSEIISCDSRQFYQGMKIGTAAPTLEELESVPHHFIANLKLEDYYNVSIFEQQAIKFLSELFKKHDVIFMVGGSGLYINALCHGIDDLPDADMELRQKLNNLYEINGLEWLQEKVQEIDPEYYNIADTKNPKRLLRALEVWEATGKTYTEQRTSTRKTRDFEILKIALNLPREELFERINLRTEQMIENGLIEEVKSLAQYRHLNSLNTVGYKEIFEYLDNKITLQKAIENIKTNTRRYAKRQITWFKKDTEFQWFSPNQQLNIIEIIQSILKDEN